MSVAARFFLVAFLFIPIICDGESPLRVVSPNRKFELVVAQASIPEEPDQPVNSFSIRDRKGRVIQQLGASEFPVEAVKWHKTADAAMVLLHIARQEVMDIITLQKGVWKKIEVTQFKQGPNFFHIVDVESASSAFKCYYLGNDSPPEALRAYRTDVNLATGQATLESAERVKGIDMPFYKQGPAAILFQLKSLSKDAPPHYRSSESEDEPDWFGVRW